MPVVTRDLRAIYEGPVFFLLMVLVCSLPAFQSSDCSWHYQPPKTASRILSLTLS